ncbi:hypothetical protein NXW38_04310 [Bacteroides ovatus]|nr:hypothetical protein [Bacteroides ovatus]
MLKCITFDGDVSTLNDLMEYLEKITQDLMEVNKLLCDKQAGQPIFLREALGLLDFVRKIFSIWKDMEETT